MAAWKFRLPDESVAIFEQGTGRWANYIDTKTQEIGTAVYVYDATRTFPDGRVEHVTTTKTRLLSYRRLAKKGLLIALGDESSTSQSA